jgi:hypothetical protein
MIVMPLDLREEGVHCFQPTSFGVPEAAEDIIQVLLGADNVPFSSQFHGNHARAKQLIAATQFSRYMGLHSLALNSLIRLGSSSAPLRTRSAE